MFQCVCYVVSVSFYSMRSDLFVSFSCVSVFSLFLYRFSAYFYLVSLHISTQCLCVFCIFRFSDSLLSVNFCFVAQYFRIFCAYLRCGGSVLPHCLCICVPFASACKRLCVFVSQCFLHFCVLFSVSVSQCLCIFLPCVIVSVFSVSSGFVAQCFSVLWLRGSMFQCAWCLSAMWWLSVAPGTVWPSTQCCWRLWNGGGCSVCVLTTTRIALGTSISTSTNRCTSLSTLYYAKRTRLQAHSCCLSGLAHLYQSLPTSFCLPVSASEPASESLISESQSLPLPLSLLFATHCLIVI